MVIIQDTREQKGKHDNVEKYFERHEIQVVRSKLFAGDYTLVNDMSVCIDTKQDILELVTNVCGQHERFMNEIKRAEGAGIKLVFLIQDPIVEDIDDLYF